MAGPGAKFVVLLACLAASVTSTPTASTQPTTTTSVSNITKPGVCPRAPKAGEAECNEFAQECDRDSDCDSDLKCCDRGCGPVCTYPSYTGCQQVRRLLAHQQHPSHDPVFIPECEDDGRFKDIQCDDASGKCWCVDDLGFELAGTRESSINLVNCSAARPCADVLCRMLCPYGFELDNEGCPICRCRNPCQGVECPAEQECQLEDIPCAEDICPPLPTCKQPRKLEDLCPIGAPLSSPDSGNPFLCGVEPNKPQCPPNYLCDVMPGNDYGVCCPLVDKPGSCPKTLHAGETCKRCNGDMDCSGTSKCCEVEGCGKTCTKPANTTLCLQQKAVVELLLSGNDGYEGYVPQCLENGEFSPKQCSSNGHLCWCVTVNGTIIAGTMGPKAGVKCTEEEEEADIQGRTHETETEYLFECEKWDCSLDCEAGFKYDGKGCKICECSEPCKDITCPEGMECMLVKMDNCFDDNCLPIATCRDTSVHCNWGKALHSNITGAVIICHNDECPESHFCEMKHDHGICCPRKIVIEHTKDSECPDFVYEPSECGHVCTSDSHCDGDMKCCPSKHCGAICAAPKSPKMPTMCEYIRDSTISSEKYGNATLAIPVPQCLPDGPYDPKQCDPNGECYCVDEFGVEIINTRSYTNDMDCAKIRDEMTCLGLICRLGCDFGFVMDEEGCPLCSCRNPCQNVSCGPNHTCQFLEVDCKDDWCPPLPYCVPAEMSGRNLPECHFGDPLMYEYANGPVMCDPFSSYPECPDTHECVAGTPRDMGICCPLPEDTPAGVDKPGQCPYLIPLQAESCDNLCESDINCEGGLKCCSNGCGTQCVLPVLKTACQHQRSAAEHRSIELGIPASRVFMPNCTEDGVFTTVQCDPVNNLCWCVDRAGEEIPGTKTNNKEKISCIPAAKNCPVFDCDIACPNGYEIDKNGCLNCKCKDLCKGIKCKNNQEACRTVTVNCISDPCPPLPLCLPKLENPCPIGEPLTTGPFGDYLQCGPRGEQCPSTHRCHLSPLGEYALCCPKPIVSTCEQLKKRNMQLRRTTNRITFLPKCNRKTGAWDPTQCMESLGLCWCVDSEGSQLPGTLVRGVPHCTARSGKSLTHTPICNNDLPVHICPDDLCDGKICLAYPNATCNIDPCGGCQVQFLDDYGKVVDCNSGLTACFAEVQKVINSGVLKPNDFLDDDLLPALEEIIDEMMLPPPAYPPPPPPPQFSRVKKRQAVHESSPFPPSYYDYDEPDYGSLDIQALQSAPASVMVPNVPTLYINIPRESPSINQDMSALLEAIPMLHSISPDHKTEVIGISQRFTVVDDGDLSFMVKPGSCPVPSLLSILRSISHGCKDQCFSDFDCPSSLKCCLYSCGLSCVPSVTTPSPQPTSKSGECPPIERWNPLACLFARKQCSSDSECTGSRKCCQKNCGMQCVKPIKKETSDVKPASLKAAAPKCSMEGGYAITQKQGELSWCVDQFGTPLHHTLTRGNVECDSNGTIISRTENGPVCADSNVTPLVCNVECFLASCPQHPEALCVADPCAGCAVKFVTFDGMPVSCENACEQPLITGNCRSSLPRYYFNQSSQKCEQFIFGGCGGNDNNFGTLEFCQEKCEKEVPLCELPKKEGNCGEKSLRWFYNKDTHQCEQFVYKGCGNANNFETREECKARCPDNVLCPWINVNGEDLTPCSRSLACRNATCPGKPDAICAVDSCTCKTSFVDKSGVAVDCSVSDQIPEETTAYLRTAVLPKHTRCQSLLKLHLLSGDNSYVPQCQDNGEFYPVQCSQGSDQHCWCVDEAGMKLPNSQRFPKGAKACSFVKMKKVEVTLAFKQEDAAYSEKMKSTIKRLIEKFLKDIEAGASDLSVSVAPDSTKIMFTLLDDNKVHVAFQLSEMMRMESMVIILPKAEMIPDPKASHFYYENENADTGVASNHINDYLISTTEYNWALFALFIAIGCVVLFLVFYVIPVVIRRRHSEKEAVFDENEKPSLISMVFHNVTYGISGCKPSKKAETPTEAPKVVIQTVEAEYESLQKKPEPDAQSTGSSEGPPAYDDIKDCDKKDEQAKE